MVVLDSLTYAGNLDGLNKIKSNNNFKFIKGTICDDDLVNQLLSQNHIDTLVHFAAESHVDRSIVSPEAFIQTNVVGTWTLLESFRLYWNYKKQPKNYRFHHISTDEVYGSLEPEDSPFTEKTPYSPNSPYSASKASSDHLVRAYHHTYQLPTLVTNCSNNYGPHQFPEKLVPLMILNALQQKSLPIYGDGQNIRDWLYVTDHCEAIACVLERENVGETYNIGGLNELTNLEVVKEICSLLNELAPIHDFDFESLITFVPDRLGHDERYTIDCSKILNDLGWSPKENFDTGLRKAVQWYLNNDTWIKKSSQVSIKTGFRKTILIEIRDE